MYLTDTNKTLEAVSDATATTTEPTVVIDYVDITTTAFTPGASLTSLNGTTDVTIVAAPAASTTRQVKYINIYNADTVTHEIIVKLNDGTNDYVLIKTTMGAGETLTYTPEIGWSNVDSITSSFRGALVYNSTDQTISNLTITALAFNTEVYDTDSIHNNTTNNSRLTVPMGVTKVRLSGGVRWDNGFASSNIPLLALITKNLISANYPGAALSSLSSVTGQFVHHNLTGPVINVVPGDYFELAVFQATGGNFTVENSGGITWFAMEIIE